MENLTKIKCTDSTYVCNVRPNGNFYEEDKLLVGVINTKFEKIRLCKSLLQIHKSDLKLDSAKNIYLFLFVDNIYIANSSFINISFFGNDENLYISNINLLTFPQKYTRIQVHISVSTQSIGKYIKIDISKLIKSFNSNVDTYNIIVEAMNPNSTSMIQFGSFTSENAPYLGVVNKPIDNTLNKTKSNNLEVKNYDVYTYDNTTDNKHFHIDESYTEIVSELNNQNLRLDCLEENLTSITDSLENKIINIKNAEIDLNDKIISTFSQLNQNFSALNHTITSLKDYIEMLKDEVNPASENVSLIFLNNLALELNNLTKSEISQLKNSVNHDILELKNSVNNELTTLKTSIKDLNENLLKFSNQLNKMSEVMENVLIRPFDDTKNSTEK